MPKDIINRASRKKGGFATITNKFLNDTKLSTDARFLMIVIANNNASTWELNFNYYQKSFSWSKPRMQKAKDELISNYYLQQQKVSTGIKFIYKYVIDETGSLKGGEPQPVAKEVQASTPPAVVYKKAKTALEKEYERSQEMQNDLLADLQRQEAKTPKPEKEPEPSSTVTKEDLIGYMGINYSGALAYQKKEAKESIRRHNITSYHEVDAYFNK
ncbi:MAG: hypothetical protein EOO46_09330 [Flavobacterium sp.]|nr:MAG: hypothetical protein EOO46_09330 [Flavobacterium sp.]